MIYYYFQAQGLYQAVLEQSHSDMQQTSLQLDLDHLSPEPPWRIFTALLDCVSRNPKLPMIMFHEAVKTIIQTQ